MRSGCDKALSVLGLAVASTVLGVARGLHPSLAGVGTHLQLGLPPCRFLLVLGIPCPSCGLTTSFAFAAHLQFGQAFLASPFGLLLFFTTVLAIPASCLQLWKRVSWKSIFRVVDVRELASWTVAAYLASWLFKLVAMSTQGTLAAYARGW